MLGLVVMLCGVGLTAAAAAERQDLLRGVVVDSAKTPVPFALVTLFSASSTDGDSIVRALTDERGRFRLPIPAEKDVRIVIRRVGFFPDTQTLSAPSSSSATITVYTHSRPIPLATLTVVGARCLSVDSIASAPDVRAAWESLETAVASRWYFAQQYRYDLVQTESSYVRSRTPPVEVKEVTSRNNPSGPVPALPDQPLYRLALRSGQLSIQTGSEYGLLTSWFRRNHCIAVAASSIPDVVSLRFASNRDVNNAAGAEGEIILAADDGRPLQFTYRLRYRDRVIAESFYEYGQIAVGDASFPAAVRIGLTMYQGATGDTATSASSRRQFHNVRLRSR